MAVITNSALGQCIVNAKSLDKSDVVVETERGEIRGTEIAYLVEPTQIAEGVTFAITEAGCLEIRGAGSPPNYNSAGEIPWSAYRESIVAFNMDETILPESMAYWFYGCSGLTSLEGIHIPDSVLDISYTFRGCGISSLDGFVLPYSIEKMSYTFSHCSKLTSLQGFVIPENVIDISYCFYRCENLGDLAGLKLPNSTRKAQGTFMSCSKLSGNLLVHSLLISYNSCFTDAGIEGDGIVVDFGNYCSIDLAKSLIATGNPDIISLGTTTGAQVGTSSVFWRVEEGCLILEGTGDTGDFDSASSVPWNSYATEITSVKLYDTVLPNSMDYWFADCINLTANQMNNGFIPASVASMQYTFMNCSGVKNIKELRVPATVTDFTGCFYGSGLTTLSGFKFRDNVVKIDKCFAECKLLGDLDNFEIPVSVLSASECFRGDISAYGTIFILGRVVSYSKCFENAGLVSKKITVGYGNLGVENTVRDMAATGTINKVLYGGHASRITYDYYSNGGTGSDAIDYYTLDSNPVNLMYTANKPGWSFVGWNDTANSVGNIQTLSVSKDTTLYAVYSKSIVARFIDFSGKSTEYSRSVFNNDTSCSFTVPAIGGATEYTGVGWTDSATSFNPNLTDKQVSLDKDTTYYGVYSKEVTLNFVPGGDQPATSVTQQCLFNGSGNTHDSEFTIPDVIPSKAGKVFLGWGLDANETTSDFVSGKKYCFNESATLYGLFQDCSDYVITIKHFVQGTDGKFSKEPIEISSATIRGNTQYRYQDCILDTYANAPGLSVDHFSQGDGNAVTELEFSVGTDNFPTIHVYYAREAVTISYDAGIADPIADSRKFYGADFSDLPVLQKEDYVFLGWYLDLEDSTTKIDRLSVCTLLKDTKIYAKWEKKRCQIFGEASLNLGVLYLNHKEKNQIPNYTITNTGNSEVTFSLPIDKTFVFQADKYTLGAGDSAIVKISLQDNVTPCKVARSIVVSTPEGTGITLQLTADVIYAYSVGVGCKVNNQLTEQDVCDYGSAQLSNVNLEDGKLISKDTNLVFVATPSESGLFQGWCDKEGNILSLNRKYSVDVSKDIHPYAMFTSKDYDVQVNTNMDEVKVVGCGEYEHGATVNLQAILDDDTRFTGWFLDKKLISTEPELQVKDIKANMNFEARFTRSVDSFEVILTSNEFTFSGNENTPAVEVRRKGKVVDSKYYTVSYSNNIKVGIGRVEIKGTVPYVGSVKANFQIKAIDFSKCTVEYTDSQVYTGSNIAPAVIVRSQGTVIQLDKDYSVEYTNNVDVGTGNIVLTGLGQYNGLIRKQFRITKATGFLSIQTNEYSMVMGDKPFYIGYVAEGYQMIRFSSKDTKVVSVSAVGRVKIIGTGAATVTVTALDTGAKVGQVKTVKIVVAPSKVSFTGRKYYNRDKLKLSWKKVSSCSGYELQISTDKKFKKSLRKFVINQEPLVVRSNNETVVMIEGFYNGKEISSDVMSGDDKKLNKVKINPIKEDEKSISYTVPKVRKGKSYYVRVRAIKESEGFDAKGVWSSVKIIRL